MKRTLGDDHLFVFGTEYLLGLTVLRARSLRVQPTGLVLLDELPITVLAARTGLPKSGVRLRGIRPKGSTLRNCARTWRVACEPWRAG